MNSAGDTNAMNANTDSLGHRECTGPGFFTGKWLGESGTTCSMPDSARDMAYGVDPKQKTRKKPPPVYLHTFYTHLYVGFFLAFRHFSGILASKSALFWNPKAA